MTRATRAERTPAHIVLADGTRFDGEAFGAEGDTTGEAVFTTTMTGYEEVLTDPSYFGQVVVMSSPEIGNVGVNEDDVESTDGKPRAAAFVVRSLSPIESNWRSQGTLDAYLKKNGVVGITEVDTRKLVRHLRDHGAQNAAIGTSSPEVLTRLAREAPNMSGLDLVRRVSPKEGYDWTEGSGPWALKPPPAKGGHVVVIDYGIKRNILRCLVDGGWRVSVLPGVATAAEVLAKKPDGVLLSNGPGDPAAVVYAIETIRGLLGKTPIFGICLGHQLLALALGAKTYKLKFGHRGANQPVKELATGHIEITTQNHGFCVDPTSLPPGVEATHVHLNDGTSEGLAARGLSASSVQFHPEAAAGPHDSRHLFDRLDDLFGGSERS